MAETETQHAMSAFSFPQPSIPHQIPTPQTSRGRGERATGGGEIVAVQGGHIVRSTGRKDRHSKVCTAKGPRDRRVRLSAHTAIQFYDVQDRLGYDRPSKAVDWLIKNAKDAIDKLAELPAWTPSTTCVSASPAGITSANPLENQLMNPGMNVNVNPSFDFPPSLDSDAIADTIKSFFPMGAASSSAAPGGRSIGFQSYTAEPLSRSGSQSTQDLRLSLQSFQDSMYHHNHQHASSNVSNLGFNTGSSSTLWPEPNQRIMQWSMPDTGTDGGGGAASYAYNMSLQNQNHHHHEASPMQNHNVLGQSQVYFQRGPLQSSNSPNIRSWAEPIGSDHPMHQTDGLYHHSVGSIGFGSGGNPGNFPGFRIPARIQGEEEEHDGLSDKPPSSSHR